MQICIKIAGRVSWLMAGLLVFSQAQAEKIALTQEKMVELVLQNSLNFKETDFKFQQYRYAPYFVYGNYEWKWSIESGYEVDKSESLSLIGDYRFERYKTLASISKSLITGTSLIFDVIRTSQQRDGDGFAGAPATGAASLSQITLDSWTIRLEQALWGNSFGTADRARIRAVENLYKSQTLLRSDEIQSLVLQGLRLYWGACVAQENYKEAANARDRYQKLVSTMQRKNTMGYTLPGEVSQVQAEYEAREFSIQNSLQENVRQREMLITFLNLPVSTEIEFVIPKTIQVITPQTPIRAEQTRFIKSQELKVQSAEDELTWVDSKNSPTLNLVARLGATGADESSAESMNEVTRGSHPTTYIGLKLAHGFGSNVREEEILNKKAALALEKIKQQRNVLEFEDRQRQAQRKVEVARKQVESLSKQKGFREKALNELNRSYTQGRTDIRSLIETMNAQIAAELVYSRAFGDYFIALNEWAALRDELVTEQKL